MFEASLVESTPLLQNRNRWPALFSFAIQAVVVSVLIVIPLLHPEVMPFATPKISLVAPRFRPTPPPPPAPVPTPVRMASATSATPAAPTQAPRISQQAFRTDAQTVDQPTLAVGLNLAGTGTNPLAALTGDSPSVARVVSGPPAATPSAKPLLVSTGVLAGLLVAPIRPEYPAIARISRTEGTVVVQAIISRSGQIESAHVLSGPAVLQASALNAVRNARYRPFLLNGQPTEVETTIRIVFQLQGN